MQHLAQLQRRFILLTSKSGVVLFIPIVVILNFPRHMACERSQRQSFHSRSRFVRDTFPAGAISEVVPASPVAGIWLMVAGFWAILTRRANSLISLW